MFDQIAVLLGGLALGLGMAIVLVVEQTYLRISDQFVRTLLYALLLAPLLLTPGAAVLGGGWWWLGPPLTLVFISLVMRVDEAEPRPGWMHPWN